MTEQCRTCGERGKDGLSLLEPENATLLQFIIIHLQNELAGYSIFVCHACVVEIKHCWRHFLTRFQTSQTHFQQVLATSKQHPDTPQQTTDVEPSLESILPKCRVLVTKLLECDLCSFCTDNKAELATHVQTHLEPNTSDRTKARRHRTNNGRGIRDLECDQCGIRYGRPEILTWHVENCHGPNRIVKAIKLGGRLRHCFQCLFCQTKFNLLPAILRHLRKQHRIENMPYSCSRCNKQFINAFKLTDHQSVDACKTKFPQVKDSGHKAEGSMKNCIKCKMCNKELKSEKHLKKHISKYHAVQRQQFKCLHCDQSFHFCKHLYYHCRDAHPGKKFIQCAGCKHLYDSYKGYMNHQKYKHRGFEFTCHICKVKLNSLPSLQRHIRSVHSTLGKSLACKFCSSKFKCLAYLTKHIREYHTNPILYCAHCKYTSHIKMKLGLHIGNKHI